MQQNRKRVGYPEEHYQYILAGLDAMPPSFDEAKENLAHEFRELHDAIGVMHEACVEFNDARDTFRLLQLSPLF